MKSNTARLEVIKAAAERRNGLPGPALSWPGCLSRPERTDYFFCSVVVVLVLVPSRASRRSSRPVRRS